MNKDLKKIGLQSEAFRQSLYGLRRWLTVKGYAQTTAYGAPRQVADCLCFMEARTYDHMQQITADDLKDYFQYLASRANRRRGGGISASHYNKQLQAMKLYSQYLWHHHQIILDVSIKHKVNQHQQPTVLTEEEVRLLYDSVHINPVLALRDKVILDVFYGCGLRRNEGLHLRLNDILIDKRVIYVSQGKQYKQRYVPMTERITRRMMDYVTVSRDSLLNGKTSDRLLISQRGRPMEGQTILLRVKALKEEVANTQLRQKTVGLHTLRHSIATHLMHRGMPIRQIARFLGHASVESTQLYTHLAHQLYHSDDR